MPKPRSATGVLREARKLLEKVGWGQFSPVIYDYSRDVETIVGYCASGALREVDTEYEDLARARLADVIRVSEPDRAFYRRDSSTIMAFNDREGQTKENVIAMFKKAEKL